MTKANIMGTMMPLASDTSGVLMYARQVNNMKVVRLHIKSLPKRSTKSATRFTADTRRMLRRMRKKATRAALQKEYPYIAV